MDKRPLVVVMGVSGSGKSTVGRMLARALDADFIDGDTLHSPENIAKMSAGIPLTDADRYPWLKTVGSTLAQADKRGCVIACSALRRSYRDLIRSEARETVFVELDGTKELLAARMDRPGHFMPRSLLESQLDALEPLQHDEVGFRYDVTESPDSLVERIETALSARGCGTRPSDQLN